MTGPIRGIEGINKGRTRSSDHNLMARNAGCCKAAIPPIHF